MCSEYIRTADDVRSYRSCNGIFLTLAWLCAASASAGDEPIVAGAQYVNMGSSFAAGSGLPPPSPAAPERCGRSDSNYASILAKRLGLVLEDRSCGGAQSVHLISPWNELPPQVEAVTRETRLVTITVGGNDLNYVGNLFAAGCTPGEGFTFNGRQLPCMQEKYVGEETYLQLKANLVEISQTVAQRAPRSKIVFIQYVTLVPPDLCEVTPFPEEKAERLREIGRRLAAITAAAARETGALLLETNTLSVAHTACDEHPWSIGATVTEANNEGIPWHPNRLGNERIADHLQEMIGL